MIREYSVSLRHIGNSKDRTVMVRAMDVSSAVGVAIRAERFKPSNIVDCAVKETFYDNRGRVIGGVVGGHGRGGGSKWKKRIDNGVG